MPEPLADHARHSADLARLVPGVRAGNTEALGALYSAVGGDLLRLATQILASEADAEDVLHDVFLGLPEALRHYDERGRFLAWLRRVTARTALARLRRSRRRSEVALSDELLDDSPSGSPGASLRRAIDALPDGLRTVLLLRSDGYSHAEIADLLAITPGASEVRLHRALKRLRNAIRPEERVP